MWSVYDDIRKKFILRVLDGAIQFIINNEEEVFLEFKRADIVKSELKYLKISSYQTTADPPHFWKIQPKQIPTGFFDVIVTYISESINYASQPPQYRDQVLIKTNFLIIYRKLYIIP